jgi:hypothetical protein
MKIISEKFLNWSPEDRSPEDKSSTSAKVRSDTDDHGVLY